MVNTFGLKMDGLRTAAMSTDDYGWRGLHYNELFYNMRTGKVWTVHQVCVNHNRGSPKLQFTDKELKNDPLTKAVLKAEKAEKRYEKAQKRLKRRKHLKAVRREVDESAADTPISQSDDRSSSPTMEDAFSDDRIEDDEKPYARLESDNKQNSVFQNLSGKEKTIPEINTGDHKTNSALDLGDAEKKKKAVRLAFEETQVRKPSRLIHPVQKTIRTAGDQLHRQAVQANKDDNVALTAVLKADTATKSALHAGEHAYHAAKLRPYRQLQRTEKALDKANIRVLEARYQQEHPQFSSNRISRWQQKRAIRKEYSAAKRGAGQSFKQTARSARQAVGKAGETAIRAESVVRKHPHLLAILALGALLLFVISGLQSCAPLAQSVLDSLVIGSYPAKEEDVKAAEQAYLDMENALKDELAHYDSYHPGYDEYIAEMDDIGHDPYVLMAIISACFDGEEWDLESAKPIIERYFHLQYTVTESITTKSFRDEDGKLQRCTVCTVTLESKNLSHLPVSTMTHHTLGMYALYMSTHGNMEGVFTGPQAVPLKEPMLYDIPQETLDADPGFAKLMDEATKYIGYPYVWGGSDPETSFDCSGFSCYVYTASGIRNMGRVGAKGIRSLCRDVTEDQLKPGDIVSFEGTMGDDVEGITHCGIYVGNHMMLHCGSPIGYVNLNDAYWQEHFHSYGRVPH